MRSIIGFAVLVAAIGFSGCCGTGGKCGLSGLGGKIGKRATNVAQETIIESGDCGCGGEVYSDPGMNQNEGADASCGCGGDAVVSVSEPCGCCGSGDAAGSVPVVSPAEFTAPASTGGCSACSAEAQTPRKPRGILKGIGGSTGAGMGLAANDRGLACNGGTADGSSRLTQRRTARSLKPNKTRATLKDKFGFAKTEDTIMSSEEYDLVSDEYIVGCGECESGTSGRRISYGVISDIREVSGAHRSGVIGCGRGGCGHGGRACGACSKIRNLAGIGSGNPYGGTIPHTAQQPGQSGMAPSYAYPYYTTRGPRDFLRDNPPSIGR